MKKSLMAFAVLLVFGSVGSVAFAAASGVVLVNSGLGQKAGDVTNFGVAICNNGSQSLAQAVIVTLSANNKTTTVNSPAPLAAGACGYSYTTYASLGMASGQTYQLSVAIGSNAPATYSVKVPAGQVLGASISVAPSTVSAATRASLLAQLASMEAILQQLLAKLHL